jgi:hypothetical protein
MTYTADFRQPRKQLNPMNAKIRGPITVELFHVGSRPKKWKARIIGGRIIAFPDSKTDMNYPEASGGATSLKAAVRDLFEEQLTPWREWLTEDEQKERDNPTPPLNKKRISGPRDNYGIKGA